MSADPSRQIQEALESCNLAALEALFERRDALSPEQRRELSRAMLSIVGQLHYDVACGKFDAAAALDIGLESAARCRLLDPDDPDADDEEIRCLVEQFLDRGDASIRDRAASLLARRLSQESEHPWLLWQLGRLETHDLTLRGAVDAASWLAAVEHYRRSVGPGLGRSHGLGDWFSTIAALLRRDGADAAARQVQDAAFRFEASTFADPLWKRTWIEHYDRLLDHHRTVPECRLPLPFAAEIERRLDALMDVVHPVDEMPIDDLRTIGHVLERRERLERALSFFRRADERQPDRYHAVYSANVCRALARRSPPGSAERLKRLAEGLDFYRRYLDDRPDGDVMVASNVADLVLDLVAATASEDRLVERAADLSREAIVRHGEHFFVNYRDLARLRCAQGREDDALTALEEGVRRLGRFLNPDDLQSAPELGRLQKHPRLIALLGKVGTD